MISKLRVWDSFNAVMIYTDIKSLVDGSKASDFRVYCNECFLDNKCPDIMELTPFIDKNGKEVFAGDVVFHSYHHMRGVMEFYDARAQWGLRSIRKDTSVFVEIFPIDASYFEVLGNKHEHPKLV